MVSSSIEYVTVFQISEHSSDAWFGYVFLVPLLAGIAMAAGKLRFKWRSSWLYISFLLGFGLVAGSIVNLSVFGDQSFAFKTFQAGSYSVAEGVVTDFHPMPYEGHDDECFSVQGRRFCYSDYSVTPGFHNSASHGGPIRDGLPVRVAFAGPIILRLEVDKDRAPTAAQSAAQVEAAQKQWQIRSERDPVEARMGTAFLMTAVFWTFWWNIQWRTVMGFWSRPPYHRFTEYAFRIFFALNFIGAVNRMWQQLDKHPLTRDNALATISTTAVMCLVVGCGSAVSLWWAKRRNA